MSKFAEHTHAGVHLEKLQHSKDDRIRTIRIDSFWRGVVLAPESGDTFCLIHSCTRTSARSLTGTAMRAPPRSPVAPAPERRSPRCTAPLFLPNDPPPSSWPPASRRPIGLFGPPPKRRAGEPPP